jgi:uncharacterized membrane protein HdeD (DUF308 family)
MDTSSIKEYASSTAPWKRNAPWWLVLAEGAILVAVGIYSLAAPDSARETIFAVFGIFLAGNGLAAAIEAFRTEPSRRTSFNAFRGGIGLSLGFMALFGRFSDYFTADSARIILAFGYLLVGIVSLVALFIARKDAKFPIGTLAFNLALVVLGIVFFTGDSSNTSRIEMIGWIAIVVGLLLIALGFFLRQRAAEATVGSSVDTPTQTAGTVTVSETVSPKPVEPARTDGNDSSPTPSKPIEDAEL